MKRTLGEIAGAVWPVHWYDAAQACRLSIPDRLDPVNREARDAPVAHSHFVAEVVRRFGFPRNQVLYGTIAALALRSDETVECDFQLTRADARFPFESDGEATVHLLGYSDRADGFRAQRFELYVTDEGRSEEERRTPIADADDLRAALAEVCAGASEEIVS